MKFIINKEIFNRWPGLKIGVIVGLEIDNIKARRKSLDLLRQEEQKQRNSYSLEDLEEKKVLQAWRQTYQDFGASSKKYSSSIEALLKRVLSGSVLPDINPLVNFYNYLSLKYCLPLGGEDLDKIKGDISLAFAVGEEKGQYIGSDKIEAALPGEVIYKDELGFICRRFNWREADRTKFTTQTKNAILIAEYLPEGEFSLFDQAGEELAKIVEEELGGKTLKIILDKKNPGFEFKFSSKASLRAEKEKVIYTPSAGWMVEEKLKILLAKAVKDIWGKKISKKEINIEHPTIANHGDLSSNLALILAKELKKSSQELGQELLSYFNKQEISMIEKIEFASPGFLNFWLTPRYLTSEAKKISNQKSFEKEMRELGKGRTVVIDYSAPNIAKAFGIGHLRSTNIGQAIYNLYSFLGWKTIGDNHLGDWGTQFGKLIVAIQKWWRKDLNKLTINDLEKLYVKFHKKEKQDKRLEKEGRLWFKKLEKGNREAKKIWQCCVNISLKEFDRVYQLLEIKIDYAYGEAFYHFKGWMEKVEKDLGKNNLLEKSQGATVIKIPGFKVPGMMIKSDGATTYLLRDMATLFFRKKTWNPDLIIYEVGADQKFHFRQLFAAAQKAGYFQKEQLIHVAHGLIRWKHAKFSTRKGDTIHLEDIIKEGIKKAGKLAEKKDRKIAQAVGIGAIKFNDLKQEPEKDIIFDWDKLLALNGYSAPYLQYTYARCASVEKRAGSSKLTVQSQKLNAEEINLLRIFYQFPEVILAGANFFAPHLLAQYLFKLAQSFNLFYQKNRIIEEEPNYFRLFLTKTTGQILKTGLRILGIPVLERM
ncbi:MAG: arginine--tRNA ligase [Candidatus Shapirobacteria bacterium]